MDLKVDSEWLIRMAELEANTIISVGGLACRVMQERQKNNEDPDGHNLAEGSMEVDQG